MRKLLLATAVAALPAAALAADVDGVWKSEANDDGAYRITMAPCAADAALTCGTISKAVTKDGDDPTYANLGKPIVENMKAEGDGNYSDGTIWDPESDKTYKSKMTSRATR
ncbi:MAG: DUF2147 domain-containing protein [Geminicoccaceae bacterium]